MRLRFGWAGRRVVVEVADPDLAADVAVLFAPLRVEDDGPDGGGPALRVTTDADGYRLRLDPTEPTERVFQDLPDLMSALEHALAVRLLEARRTETHLHAAAAVLEGRTVVAVGASGRGKSSLTLAWSLAGHPIVSDDTILVDEAGRVSGLPRLVKVDRRQLRIHGLAVTETVAPQGSNPEVWWDPSRSGGWAADPRLPALVAHVQFVRGRAMHLTRLSDVETLRILLDNVLPGGLRPEESVDRFLEIVRSARLVELTFGSAREAASVLHEAASGEAP